MFLCGKVPTIKTFFFKFLLILNERLLTNGTGITLYFTFLILIFFEISFSVNLEINVINLEFFIGRENQNNLYIYFLNS